MPEHVHIECESLDLDVITATSSPGLRCTCRESAIYTAPDPTCRHPRRLTPARNGSRDLPGSCEALILTGYDHLFER